MGVFEIISIVLGLLTLIFGTQFSKGKTIIKEVGVLINVIADALADNTLTREELAIIIAQLKLVLSQFKKSKIVEASKVIKNLKK